MCDVGRMSAVVVGASVAGRSVLGRCRSLVLGSGVWWIVLCSRLLIEGSSGFTGFSAYSGLVLGVLVNVPDVPGIATSQDAPGSTIGIGRDLRHVLPRSFAYGLIPAVRGVNLGDWSMPMPVSIVVEGGRKPGRNDQERLGKPGAMGR